MAYTKAQLENMKKEYLQNIADIDTQLEAIGDNTLKLQGDKAKPFKKYSMAERQNLYNINQKAYEWLAAHKDESVLDYNMLHAAANRVVLEV